MIVNFKGIVINKGLLHLRNVYLVNIAGSSITLNLHSIEAGLRLC